MRYRYSPFEDRFILSSLVFLQTTKDVFMSLTHLVIDMKLHTEYLADTVVDNVQAVPFDYRPIDTQPIENYNRIAGELIRELRRCATSYYDYWILRHMIRVMLITVFGYDIANYTLAIKHRLND